jgi:hypothetical protein
MKTLYLSLLTLTTTASTAFAQNLTKEIVVDKDIILEQRDVTPLSIQPKLVVGDIPSVTLPWSSTAVPSDPTTEIAVLPPAAWRLAVEESQWRGYVRAGYFPLLQGDVSAGYRAIARNDMRLDLWGQYTGLSYKNKLPASDYRLTNNDVTVGTNYHWAPIDNALLTAGVDYLWSSYTMPRYLTDAAATTFTNYGFRQTVSDINARVAWQHNINAIDYGARIALGRFAFGHGAYYGAATLFGDFKALSQTKLSAEGHVAGRLSDAVAAQIQLTYDGVYNPAGAFQSSDEAAQSPSTNYGIFVVRPTVVAHNDYYRLQLGLTANIRTGEISKFNIYPDVRIDWTPSQQFSIYATCAGGRVNLNSLSNLFSRTRYINPSAVITPSAQKLSVEGGITIGPFKGFAIDINAAAANWSGVVMPLAGDLMTIGTMENTHFKSLYGGAAVRYEYADLIKLRIAYQAASHGRENGCVDWLDRAEGVFTSNITVTPLTRLAVNAGYDMRHGRHAYTADGSRVSLSTTRDLHLGVTYNATSRLTVEANAHNLTAARWLETPGVKNPGITGFLGVTYKF